jgi:hypothetical protein
MFSKKRGSPTGEGGCVAKGGAEQEELNIYGCIPI